MDAPPTLSRGVFFAALFATLAMASAAEVGLFGIGPWEAVLAVLLSFVLAVVAARVSGETGITPIGAMGKITQLTYSLVTPGNVTANLMSANVTGGAAGQCADLLHDLRTGEIIGATPRFQVVAQCFGVLTGSLVGSLVYLVLIPHPRTMLITPEWPAPAVAVWKAVAEVLAQGLGAVPPGAVPAMAVAAVLGLVLALAESLLPQRLARLLPSAPAIGLAFVIPAWNSLSLFLGAAGAAAVARAAPDWTKPAADGAGRRPRRRGEPRRRRPGRLQHARLTRVGAGRAARGITRQGRRNTSGIPAPSSAAVPWPCIRA